MKFDLATLRTRIGLAAGDTSRDTELQVGLDLVIAVLETYLDRKLLRSLENEFFTHFVGNVVSLKRYPIVTVNSIDSDGNPVTTPYHIGYDAGLVHFDGVIAEHEMQIAYQGGFAELPEDLALAALMVFDVVWPSVGGGGAATVTAGAIQSVTLQDVGTVRYSTGAAAASAASQGLIPGAALSILEKYARVGA